tara:strand:- start:581 stop:1132 length:552 start_codon:yes stop_codon:yes gene_type:complete
MSRTVPASILTALSQPEVQPFYAVEFMFDSAPIRFWTGYGDRTIETNTYTGTGNLMSIGGLEEVADMSAKSANITLNGIPPALISLALQEPYQNRECRILFGVIDSSDIVEVFAGTMDRMTIQDGGETGTIDLKVESKWVRLDRPNIRRYTSESQKSRHLNDTFFDYVAELQDKEVLWGRTSA